MRHWLAKQLRHVLNLDSLYASLGWYPPYPIYESGNRPCFHEGPVEWNQKLIDLAEEIRRAGAAVYPRSVATKGERAVEFDNAINTRQIIGLPAYPLFMATVRPLLRSDVRMISTGVSVRMLLPEFNPSAKSGVLSKHTKSAKGFVHLEF